MGVAAPLPPQPPRPPTGTMPTGGLPAVLRSPGFAKVLAATMNLCTRTIRRDATDCGPSRSRAPLPCAPLPLCRPMGVSNRATELPPGSDHASPRRVIARPPRSNAFTGPVYAIHEQTAAATMGPAVADVLAGLAACRRTVVILHRIEVAARTAMQIDRLAHSVFGWEVQVTVRPSSCACLCHTGRSS